MSAASILALCAVELRPRARAKGELRTLPLLPTW